ncbi:hypothetical protein Trydic_g3059 [Trypoxylus dichotomus]
MGNLALFCPVLQPLRLAVRRDGQTFPRYGPCSDSNSGGCRIDVPETENINSGCSRSSNCWSAITSEPVIGSVSHFTPNFSRRSLPRTPLGEADPNLHMTDLFAIG